MAERILVIGAGIAGLCLALARNFKSTVAGNLDIVRPIAFQGGVAANAGMVPNPPP